MQLDRFSFKSDLLQGDSESIFDLFVELTSYELNCEAKKSNRHNSIDLAIYESLVLGQWQQARSDAGSYPIYSRYLKSYREFNNDYLGLGNEIQDKGLFLPPGQILFRGSLSGEHGFDWKRPLSTTLHPRIAAYHAYKHWKQVSSRPPITLAAIVLPSDKRLRAIMGPFGEGVEFGHEYEVLINFNQPPIIIETRELCDISYQILSW